MNLSLLLSRFQLLVEEKGIAFPHSLRRISISCEGNLISDVNFIVFVRFGMWFFALYMFLITRISSIFVYILPRIEFFFETLESIKLDPNFSFLGFSSIDVFLHWFRTYLGRIHFPSSYRDQSLNLFCLPHRFVQWP